MPYIRSANQSRFSPLQRPGPAVYSHGAQTRRGYIPLAFQVTSPYDKLKSLLPHALIAHVNPSSFGENFNKKVEKIQTRGGFVEQHWGDELGEISVEQSTGAFVNLQTGLSSILRHRTIAWDRYQDLYDLYHNNGSVYDPSGAIVLQGYILLMYDRGTYLGFFRSFSMEETEESPFAFKLSWTFKVVETVYQVPINSRFIPQRNPNFQSLNQANGAFAQPPTGSGVVVETEAERSSRLANEARTRQAQEMAVAARASAAEPIAQASTLSSGSGAVRIPE